MDLWVQSNPHTGMAETIRNHRRTMKASNPKTLQTNNQKPSTMNKTIKENRKNINPSKKTVKTPSKRPFRKT